MSDRAVPAGEVHTVVIDDRGHAEPLHYADRLMSEARVSLSGPRFVVADDSVFVLHDDGVLRKYDLVGEPDPDFAVDLADLGR